MDKQGNLSGSMIASTCLYSFLNGFLLLPFCLTRTLMESVSTTVTDQCKWGQELEVSCEEVKGGHAVGLVKMPFSFLQGYYVMVLGIGGSPCWLYSVGSWLIYSFSFKTGTYSLYLKTKKNKNRRADRSSGVTPKRPRMCILCLEWSILQGETQGCWGPSGTFRYF